MTWILAKRALHEMLRILHDIKVLQCPTYNVIKFGAKKMQIGGNNLHRDRALPRLIAWNVLQMEAPNGEAAMNLHTSMPKVSGFLQKSDKHLL